MFAAVCSAAVCATGAVWAAAAGGVSVAACAMGAAGAAAGCGADASIGAEAACPCRGRGTGSLLDHRSRCDPAELRHRVRDHLFRRAAVGLPGQAASDANANRDQETGDGASGATDRGRLFAQERGIPELGGANRRQHRRRADLRAGGNIGWCRPHRWPGNLRDGGHIGCCCRSHRRRRQPAGRWTHWLLSPAPIARLLAGQSKHRLLSPAPRARQLAGR